MTAGLPLIVVMPDAGPSPAGTYDGASAAAAWETFHIGQLIPWSTPYRDRRRAAPAARSRACRWAASAR